MARTGQFIYLKTRGYLDIDRDTNQVRSFICLNTLISEDEGRKLIHEMKKKFAIMIQENEYADIECDEPAVENPVQLERAILSLITNLHGNSSNCDENMVSSPIESSYYSDDQQTETESHRSIKSPPLALIAPKSDTIKDSIQNSVKVIANAARTRTPDIGSPRSNASSSPISVSTVSPSAVPSTSIISSSTDDENHKRPSVVQKIENCQPKQPPLIQKTSRLASPSIGYISSSSSSASSTSTLSNSSSCTTDIVQQQFEPTDMHAIKIKEEPISDFRVPPLPTSASYFTEEPTTYMMPSSSSESAYDYGDINSDPSQPSQQHHRHHHEPSAHHRSGLISTTTYKVHQAEYDPSMGRTTSTMLKRTHSYEMMDNLAKRRYPNTYSSGLAKLLRFSR